MWSLVTWLLDRIAARYDSGEEFVQAAADRVGVDVWVDREAAVRDLLEDELQEGELFVEGLPDVDGELVALDATAIRDLDRQAQLARLADLADELGLPPEAWCIEPVAKIRRLEDRDDLAYLWLLQDSATGADVDSLTRKLESAYRDEFGREPRAMHFVLRDVEEVQQLPPSEVEQWIKPWLREHHPEVLEED